MFILTIIQMAGVAVLLLRVWLINHLKRKRLDLDRTQRRLLQLRAADKSEVAATTLIKAVAQAGVCHTWLRRLGAKLDEAEMDLARYDLDMSQQYQDTGLQL